MSTLKNLNRLLWLLLAGGAVATTGYYWPSIIVGKDRALPEMSDPHDYHINLSDVRLTKTDPERIGTEYIMIEYNNQKFPLRESNNGLPVAPPLEIRLAYERYGGEAAKEQQDRK